MPYKNKPKRKIKKFDFSKNDAHVALVSQAQGGPANEEFTLLFKSADSQIEEIEKQITEITVSLSFHQFLMKFFDIWYDDAALLAAMLGFDTSEVDAWAEEHIEEKLPQFTIMKQAHESKEDWEAVLDKASLEDCLNILQIQEKFEKALESSGSEDDKGDIKEDKVIKSSDKPKDDKGNEMSEKEYTPEQIAELEKQANAKTELEKEMAELRKAAEELEQLKKQRVELEKAKYVDLVKGYTFIEEGKKEVLSKALFDVSNIEGVDSILEALEKANNIAIEFGETEHGQSGDGEDISEGIEKSKRNVDSLIEARKSRKAK